MAASSAVEKLKVLWDSQVNDEEQWALNYAYQRCLLGSYECCFDVPIIPAMNMKGYFAPKRTRSVPIVLDLRLCSHRD
uniref:Uncharacterized protein n=1 Tax=Zea mays TaxID=4577 RepID=A0A804M0J2_MAIZE